MKKKWLVLSTGFALFSMFFGSGNLVFPIVVGKESGPHFLFASLGIILTGAVVPLLGAFSSFFGPIGKTGTFVFSIIALSLLGPFAVVPRCMTVAHGALQLLIPSASLVQTSFIFFALIFVLTLNRKKVISILGSVLTPLLLLAIAAISLFALKDGVKTPLSLDHIGSFFAFKNGFFMGYHMMDLLAGFFFSTFVIEHLNSKKTDGSSLKIFMQSALLGGGLLACVYAILVALGSLYGKSLEGLMPQQMLGHIAMKTLGPFGAPCLCMAVVLACSTTAIVLVSLFSDFLYKEILKEKIPSHYCLLATVTIGFFVSTLGFTGISAVLSPIIEIIYPALIALTLVNIAHKLLGTKNTHWPVTITLATKVVLASLALKNL
jgi:branched-chain amino acid:cation transporter, LIVCS family